MKIGFGIGALAGVSMGALLATTLAAQSNKPRNVWDGVYTTSQAARGEASYTENCGGCHMPTLSGRGEAPALKGDAFMDRWHDYNLKPLFDLIRVEMPPLRFRTKDTHPLDDNVYIDIIAYVLKVNGFPEGNAELSLPLLEKTQILGKNGAQPPPNFALVLSVGCMVARSSGWVLDNASDPVRATKADEATPQEVQAAQTKLLGIRQFRVVDFGYLGADFEPDEYAGHKIQVKGYLIRQPEFERISVTSLTDVAARCR